MGKTKRYSHTLFWWKNLERPLGRPWCRWKDINMDLKSVGKAWIGFMWLRTGSSSGFL
jgi:hypothetical protein